MESQSHQRLECIVQETGPSPKHGVVWLHGLGADGNDFAPIVPHLQSAARRPVRFIFPHAPTRPVTINGGMSMRAWYDILGMEIDRNQDQAGIASSLAQVGQLLDDQIENGIPPENLILAGFSQGGAIALRLGLTRSPSLAGVMVLSAYLLDEGRLAQWSAQEARQVPIFIGHGSQDPVVPVSLGQASADQLKEAGFSVDWQTWPMPHSVCPEELAAIDAWMERCWA